MAQLKDTTITGGLSVSGTANITGATQHSADVTLYSSSGDSPAIYFQRGTTSDTLNDYKIYDTSGYLTIKQSGNSGTSGYTQVAKLTNTGILSVSTPPATDTNPTTSAWISPTDSGIKIATDATIANGDKLVIRDADGSNLMKSSSITFGTSTTTFLRNDGQWRTVEAGPTVLKLRYLGSKYILINNSVSSPSPSDRLNYNQIMTYLNSCPVLIKPATTTNTSGIMSIEGAKTINIIGMDGDTTPLVLMIEIKVVDSDGLVYYNYIKFTASSATTGFQGTSTTDAGMTVAQITTGTNTSYRPVSAKVIHDYIASLDATNVAY